MNAHKVWSRTLITIGTLAMLVGALDPMEGSLVILPGSGLIALGTFLGNRNRQLRIYWLAIFLLVAFGVGALFGLGALGLYKGSKWWPLLILPYPIGWAMGLVSLLFRLARAVREQHITPAQEERK